MKQKKQAEKKLSLKKLQLVRISNPKVVKGGNDFSLITTMQNLIDNDGGNTGTVGTSRKD